MDFDNLSTEEISEVRQFLRERRMGNAKIRVESNPPVSGWSIGKVGRFIVWAIWGVAGVLDIILIRQNAMQAYGEYEPPIAQAFEAINECTSDIQVNLDDCGPLSGEQFADGDPIVNPTTTTTTPDPNQSMPRYTSVGSLGYVPNTWFTDDEFPPCYDPLT